MKIKYLILVVLVMCICALVGCNEEKPNKRAITAHPQDVATVTIFASTGDGEKVFGLFNFGHAFIMLTNISDEETDICGYKLLPGQSATISTWSLTDKFGVWFNVEGAFIAERNKYADRVSVTAGVSKENMTKIADYITRHNKWSISTNCTAFSVGLFNTLVDEDERVSITGIYTPAKLKEQIINFESYEECAPVIEGDTIGYLDDSFVGGYILE